METERTQLGELRAEIAEKQSDLQTNKAIVRRIVDEFLNSRDTSVADELWHADYAWRPLSGDAEAMDRETHKRDYNSDLRSIFPDLVKTVEEQVAEGDLVGTRCTMRGTNLGDQRTPMGDVGPVGKTISWTTLSMHRFDNGRVREGWIAYNPVAILQQLGLIPACGDSLFQALRPRGGAANETEPPPAVTQGDTTESNKAIVRDLLKGCLEDGKHGLADELFDRSYSGTVDAVQPRDELRTTFPDLRCGVDEQVAEGDLVLTRFTLTGTQLGPLHTPWSTVAPTGRQVRSEVITLHQLRNGKVIADWIVYDPMRIFQQVGTMPEWPVGPGSARPMR